MIGTKPRSASATRPSSTSAPSRRPRTASPRVLERHGSHVGHHHRRALGDQTPVRHARGGNHRAPRVGAGPDGDGELAPSQAKPSELSRISRLPRLSTPDWIEFVSRSARPMLGAQGQDHHRFRPWKERTLERLEEEFLEKALADHGGNVSRAARTLGIHRSTLQRFMRKHNLSVA